MTEAIKEEVAEEVKEIASLPFEKEEPSNEEMAGQAENAQAAMED